MSERRAGRSTDARGIFESPLLFCYRMRPSGKQVGAQHRYRQEKIIPLRNESVEISTSLLTIEESELALINRATQDCSCQRGTRVEAKKKKADIKFDFF